MLEFETGSYLRDQEQMLFQLQYANESKLFFAAFNKPRSMKIDLFPIRKLPWRGVNGSCIFRRPCLSLDNASFLAADCLGIFSLK